MASEHSPYVINALPANPAPPFAPAPRPLGNHICILPLPLSLCLLGLNFMSDCFEKEG